MTPRLEAGGHRVLLLQPELVHRTTPVTVAPLKQAFVVHLLETASDGAPQVAELALVPGVVAGDLDGRVPAAVGQDLGPQPLDLFVPGTPDERASPDPPGIVVGHRLVRHVSLGRV